MINGAQSCILFRKNRRISPERSPVFLGASEQADNRDNKRVPTFDQIVPVREIPCYHSGC